MDIITKKDDLAVLPPESMLQEIKVLSGTMLEYINATVRRAVTCEVTNDAELETAAEILNSATKSVKHIEESVTEARRPVLAFADSITATVAGLKATTMDARAIVADKIKLYQDEREAARQRILAEQRRVQEEAAAKARAEQAERERVAREAAAKAEAARREQERLAWEAQERERLAAEAIMNGKRSQESVTDNSAALAAAAEVERQAEAARLAAEEAERQAAEAARAAAAPMVAEPVIIQAAPAALGKVKGMKTKRVVEGLAYDVAKLPAAYLEVDEVKLKKHILDGAVTLETPGVKAFQISEVIMGSGR